MDNRIFTEFAKVSCLCLLAGSFVIMIMFAMDAEQRQREQELGKFTVDRPAIWLEYEAQYGKSPE